MKLDSKVRLLQSADAVLKQQGVDAVMQERLKDKFGTVIDKQKGAVQVSFEFDKGRYHTIQVWVDPVLLTGYGK